MYFFLNYNLKRKLQFFPFLQFKSEEKKDLRGFVFNGSDVFIHQNLIYILEKMWFFSQIL